MDTIQDKWIDHLREIDIKSYTFPWCPDKWKDVKSYIFKIIVVNDEPRGFAAFKLKKEGGLFLAKLCVHPKFRGQGYGSLLQQTVLREAQKNKRNLLIMILDEDNGFFGWAQKWGWRAVGVKKSYFPDGTDGYIFERVVII